MKKITYLEEPALAIYFQNMTQLMTQVRLEGQVLKEKNRNESMQSYTSTISHEFRTPLGTSLIFLETLLQTQGLSSSVVSTLKLVVMQLTLLLSLVNDVLDLKMIDKGKFVAKLEDFKPVDILNFVTAIFKPHAEL